MIIGRQGWMHGHSRQNDHSRTKKGTVMNTAVFVSSDDIRGRFSKAMSEMYRKEVPQYGVLLELVESINRQILEDDTNLRDRMQAEGELERLNVERHGAIRVGTSAELNTLRRLFAVMGMQPVGYYDLSEAGVPVHSTAFRPISEEALRHNPFRVFTSLLRLDLIENKALSARAEAILAKRDIFTNGVRELIETHESQGGLTDEQTKQFVKEALQTFRWHQNATVDLQTYNALHDEHRLVADVVCFRGPHINHLTPRTLDIDEAQRCMPTYGMNPKAIIEGPPYRRYPILLRQTSFKALEEDIHFSGEQPGTHTARFGEIEQRGMALTSKGRQLYDRLLADTKAQAANLESSDYQQKLQEIFEEFPDDLETLRREKLAYFRYTMAERSMEYDAWRSFNAEEDWDAFVEQGLIDARPIIYEDFLPVSAAGIFQSNLGDSNQGVSLGNSNKAAFEEALGCQVIDELELYAGLERASKEKLLRSYLASVDGERL